MRVIFFYPLNCLKQLWIILKSFSDDLLQFKPKFRKSRLSQFYLTFHSTSHYYLVLLRLDFCSVLQAKEMYIHFIFHKMQIKI